MLSVAALGRTVREKRVGKREKTQGVRNSEGKRATKHRDGTQLLSPCFTLNRLSPLLLRSRRKR